MELDSRTYDGLTITLNSNEPRTEFRITIKAPVAASLEDAHAYAKAFFSKVPGVPSVKEDASAGTVEVTIGKLNLEAQKDEGADATVKREDYIKHAFTMAHERAIDELARSGVAVGTKADRPRGW